jgi:hypothetical protein
MAKQKYVDRGGKEIKREVLEEYEVIGVQNYNSKTNVITILVERRKPPPVLGCAIMSNIDCNRCLVCYFSNLILRIF